jgi:hypothetical protein
MVADFTLRADHLLTLKVVAVACLISFCFAVLHLWEHRDLFDPEGISYLDIADAYRRGDWRVALTGLWSPLYSWLLALVMILFNPSAQWEFTAVHSLNVFIYVVTLASFSVFLWELLRVNNEVAESERLPDWSWVILGYSLFTWGTIQLVPLHLPEPDLFVSALVYLLLAMLLRIRKGNVTWGESIFLGVLMAVGYLTKAIMFPMAFVFTAVALALTRRSRTMLFRILVSFFLFLSLSLPYIVALSNAKGHWTYSEAGRLNYAWDINKVTLWIHWQGENPAHGTPLHPTRKIHDDPPMYEFATPFNVTYPPWYDPSYWYEGVKVSLDLQRQFEVLLANTKHLLYFLVNSPGPATAESRASGALSWGYERTLGPLLALFCAIILINLGRISFFRAFAGRWFLLVPIGAGLTAYTLLHLEGRLIVAYVVALWMVLFQSVAIPKSAESKRAFTAILTSAALIVSVSLIPGTARAMRHASHYLTDGNIETPFLQSGHTNWRVAEFLHNAGLRAGDPVGSVGSTYEAYWARMARLHVVSEIPEDGAKAFWSSDTAKQAVVMQLFRNTGAKAVVGSSVPAGSVPANWRRVGDTDYYAYVFPRGDSK